MKKTAFLYFILFLPTLIFSQSQLNFDGYQDHVVLNGSDFPPPWTAEVLVRKNEIGAYSHLLTSTDGTSGFRLEQYINNNKIGITSAGIADWSFNYQLPLGEWVHLAFTCDGSAMKLFVNGHETGGSINGSINMPLGMIGLNTTGAGALNSKIDELRIWNTVLPQSSIASYMLDSIPNDHPQYDQLLHYYRFDEGSGNTIFDSKGNLNGNVVGATFCPVLNKDIAAVALLSPAQFVGSYSTSQMIKFRISNAGASTINEDFEVSYAVDGGAFQSQTIEASLSPILSFASTEVEFPAIDLTGSAVHSFELIVDLPGDENPANDTLIKVSSLNVASLQELTDFTESNGEFIFSSHVSKVKVTFQRNDIFRIQLAPAGIFTDPTNGEIVTIPDIPLTTISSSDEGGYYKLESAAVVLRVYKSPLTFALYDHSNTEMIWEESLPLSFGQQSWQKMTGFGDEHFYGCGMQNGYFSHKGKSIKIENIYGDWSDGDVPNPAPFYMSTKGYGAFRNTFNKGQYNFLSTTTLTHQENHFDSFYFYGPGLKEVLEGYTYVTGRPFMMPRWGLEFGDADCYNDTGTTADVIDQIAQKYRDMDMPGGWILPNDGYSCGYEDLEYVVGELKNLGFYTGLWTEDGVGNIAYEVGTAGTRCVKLDVALVGPGYQSAFNSGTDAFNGIENNSDDRGYVWTVAGWAGTQRFATIWSGDQYGTWENIRFHIPTVIGSGLSGFNAATGDIDGIFGGSGATYVRDLQWKCFTPAMMTISGWAATGKQPWGHGAPFTSYNRDYLKLKMRLSPYFYTYCKIAHETGVPTVRAMVLEFPDDPVTYDNTTQYQFMSGASFLVAPVYSNTNIRDGIYLPEGTWIDYWDGTRYEGPMMLDGYEAPLSKLPLLVKAGAIIPMYSEMLYDDQIPKDTITYDIYPQGHSSFTLYEDDGHSKAYRNGAFAETNIEVEAPQTGFDEPIIIQIGATTGDYEGKLDSRSHIFQVHFMAKPGIVKLDGQAILEWNSKTEWENGLQGWYYDATDKNGIVFIKTENFSVSNGFEIRLEDFVSSLQTIENEIHIKVFPNPAEQSIIIDTESNVEIEAISIYNTNGRFITKYKGSLSTGKLEINLPEEVSGSVLIEIDIKGKGKIQKMVVIQK